MKLIENIYRAQHSGSYFRDNSNFLLHRLLFRFQDWDKASIKNPMSDKAPLTDNTWKISLQELLGCDRIPVAVTTCEGNFLNEPWVAKCSCCGSGRRLPLTAWTEAVGFAQRAEQPAKAQQGLKHCLCLPHGWEPAPPHSPSENSPPFLPKIEGTKVVWILTFHPVLGRRKKPNSTASEN